MHLALLEAGIRNRVEIWADGGYRHGWDIVKLHCLGANRVAFGTLAMVSLGCTICRGCQLDTCHVGIATQIDSMEEAEEKGLKKFTPQEFERAVENCARFFQGMGEEVREVVAEPRLRARPGPRRPQRPAGAGAREAATIDLAEMIRPLEEMLDLEPIDMPAGAEEEREEAGLIVARPIRMAGRRRPRRSWRRLATEVCGGTGAASSERRRSGADGWPATAERRGARSADGDCHAGRGRSHEYPRPVDANDRVLGTELAGADLARSHLPPGHGAALRRWTRSPTCTSTAARSAARDSARSTCGASTSGSRAARRTVSARRCSAGRSPS